MRKVIPCVLITLLMMSAGSFLPLLGFLGVMLCPLPLCVIGCTEGRKAMSVAELMIEVTLFFIMSPSTAVYFMIGCAPVSAMMYMLSREDIRNAKKFTGGESLLICAGVSVIFKTILLAAFWFFTGKNILFPDAEQMSAVMSELYGDQPELQATLAQVMRIFPHLLPSMLMIYSGIESYINYRLCNPVIKKISPDCKSLLPELPEFRMWKFPVSIFLVSVGGFLLGWLIDADEWFTGTMFILNLQLVANVLMFIQGLSLAFWIMEGFKLRKGIKTAICFVLMIPFFWAWLIVMGMCEMSFNLRERIKFKESK